MGSSKHHVSPGRNRKEDSTHPSPTRFRDANATNQRPANVPHLRQEPIVPPDGKDGQAKTANSAT